MELRYLPVVLECFRRATGYAHKTKRCSFISDETNIQAVKGSKGRFDLMLGTLLVGKKYGRHVITNPYKLIAL